MKGVWIESLTMQEIKKKYPDLNAQEYQCQMHHLKIKKIGSPVEIEETKQHQKKWFYKVKDKWFDETQVCPVIDPVIELLNQMPEKFKTVEFVKAAEVKYKMKLNTVLLHLQQARKNKLITNYKLTWQKLS